MNDTSIPSDTETAGSSAMPATEQPSRREAYIELTKMRISVMVLFTFAVPAILEAGSDLNILVLLSSMAGMLLLACSGNAMNMFIERYTDFLMPRTSNRPLPAGRLSATEVATFGAVTLGASLAILLACTNWQTAACGVANWILYVFIYTPLKRHHWINTEVGSIAGALPVLMGSLATTGTVGVIGWSLFGVLVFWQFPHFMAIAWKYRDQYAKGGLKMLTVVDPSGLRAGRKSVITAVLLIVVSLVPVILLPSIWHIAIFSLVALGLGWAYLKASIFFARDRNDQTARSLMLSSLLYLPLYMLALVIACWT